jgi:hypothetical protein
MIPYTERDTDLNFQPPYRITGVEALASVRRIDTAAAQDWVDETLNWRPQGMASSPEFTALPLAFVIFMKMGAMRSLRPPHDDWGSVSESELAVTLPLLAWDNRGLPSLPELMFYPVVLCLDSGPALISGREVFGFPKIMGRVEIGADGGEARCEVAVAPGHPVTLPDELLLALRRLEDGPAVEGPRSFGGGLAAMVRDELIGGMDESWVSHLLRQNPARQVLNLGLEWLVDAMARLDVTQQFVFLKQFRDVADPRLACHRSVASCPLTFSRLARLERERGDWELEVPAWRSSGLLRRLGLESGKIAAPLRSAFQIDLGCGRTLWKS